jgi:hypothetical protein
MEPEDVEILWLCRLAQERMDTSRETPEVRQAAQERIDAICRWSSRHKFVPLTKADENKTI